MKPGLRRSPFFSLVAAVAWGVLPHGTVVAGQEDLRSQVEALAARSGFIVEGLERIGSDPAREVEGTPAERLKALLREYNYLVVLGRAGTLEKVRISSRKADEAKGAADAATVPTTRVGSHHQVEAMIVGPNGVAETVPLIVDTGASTLVLPDSMIPELGFAPETLRPGKSQTAVGQVQVKMGMLRSVRLGAVTAEEVEVSFIADRKLGGTKLLGMSFLQRFRMTMDDTRNELILLAK